MQKLFTYLNFWQKLFDAMEPGSSSIENDSNDIKKLLLKKKKDSSK